MGQQLKAFIYDPHKEDEYRSVMKSELRACLGMRYDNVGDGNWNTLINEILEEAKQTKISPFDLENPGALMKYISNQPSSQTFFGFLIDLVLPFSGYNFTEDINVGSDSVTKTIAEWMANRRAERVKILSYFENPPTRP